jgi:hypothetical protein
MKLKLFQFILKVEQNTALNTVSDMHLLNGLISIINIKEQTF